MDIKHPHNTDAMVDAAGNKSKNFMNGLSDMNISFEEHDKKSDKISDREPECEQVDKTPPSDDDKK